MTQEEKIRPSNPFRRITSWYASRKAMPYWTVLIFDSLMAMISGYVGYTLVKGGYNVLVNFWPLTGTLAFYLIFYILSFRIFHTYSGILRFSSFIDLQRVSFAVGLGMLFCLSWMAIPGLNALLFAISPLAIVLQGLFTVILMSTARVWGKMMYESYQHSRRHARAFIYSNKSDGVAMAKSLNTDANSPYILAGFVSDDPYMWDKIVVGQRVYQANELLIEHMKQNGANYLLVSSDKMDNLRVNTIFVDKLIDAGIHIMVTPKAREWDGKSSVNLSQLREVNAEDLLPRDSIEVELEGIAAQLAGKRILITGAAGSIGSEIVRQVARFKPSRLILIDQAETPLHDIRLMMKGEYPDVESETIVADIANQERMADIFRKYSPEYVFHAAAYKHVPMMEDNPNESIINNVKGTMIVADLSVQLGVEKFVMVSTDKAVNPTNVMGCSKRICEIYVQALDKAEKSGRVNGHTQFVTTRFGNVLGSNGSVIPLFKKQIERGGPVTVTHPDIIRFFMLIPEACKLVLEAGTMGHGGEIFVFDMGKPVKIVDLARRMIRLSGVKDVEIKFTGLRDGEKLYEEVLSDMEQTKPTFHPKIMIATVREYDFDSVCKALEELISKASASSPMDTVRRMKAIVPEFKSQHSVYEELDK
ncbi:MAG: polysaccharide biosynthesis protein [Muribaculum sp.]|nr:polysaccharide biosynthesis protein [Muribaculum sp.]